MGSSIIKHLGDFERCNPRKAIRCRQKVKISGQSGLKLRGVEALASMLIDTHGPGTVIIHAGANDIGNLKGHQWKQKIEEIAKNLKSRYPRVLFVWSDMVPRLDYRNHNTKQAEKKRRRYQRVAREAFLKEGGTWVTHPIMQIDRSLLCWDEVHHNDEGHNQLLRDFEQFIASIEGAPH